MEYLATETAHSTGSLYTPPWMVHVPQLGRGSPHRISTVVQHGDTCVHTAVASCRSESSIAPLTSFVAGCMYGREGGEEGRGRGRGVLFHMAIEHPYKQVSFLSLPWSHSQYGTHLAEGLGMRLSPLHCLLLVLQFDIHNTISLLML